MVNALSMPPKSPRFEYSKRKLVVTGRAFGHNCFIASSKTISQSCQHCRRSFHHRNRKNLHRLFYRDKFNSSGEKSRRQYTYDQHVKYQMPCGFTLTSSLLLDYHVKQYIHTYINQPAKSNFETMTSLLNSVHFTLQTLLNCYHFGLLVDLTIGVIPSRYNDLVLLKLTMLKMTR